MTFKWTWIIWAFVVAWCIGWFVCALYMFFFGPGSEDKIQDRKDRLMGSFFISAVLWPVLLPSTRRFMRFQRDLQTGKRPQWLVYADDEQRSAAWTLKDGIEFWASPVGGSSHEPTWIQAGLGGGATAHCVECRIRAIAPEEGQPCEWRQMQFKKPIPDPEDEVEEGDDEPYYETSFQLGRGKYRVDFRVRLDAGEAEEFGAVTLIVSDDEDYDL